MWAYSEEYIDEFDGRTTAPFVPPYAALVGTTDPSGTAYYGSVLQLDAEGFQESHQAVLVPRLMYDEPNESAEFRLQSRPALVPRDVASWTVVNCTPPARPKKSPAIPTEGSEPKPP
jgi:hypothetical protein